MAKGSNNSKTRSSNGKRNRGRLGAESYSPKDTQHKYNDVSWYAKNDNILRDAASFSYNSPLGGTLDLLKYYGAGTPGYTMQETGPKSIAGLASMAFVPTIGVSTGSASPANLAAQNIYTYVRYMNSGSKNYDQADLMLYLLAMDSVYMVWNWMKRMYGYVRTYSQKNMYMPNGYAIADSVQFSSIRNNMADFRCRLNQLAAQISSFCVPAVMPLFVRHSWMVSNIYKDADSDKAQQFIFVPRLAYKYSETGSTYGGSLVPIELTRDLKHLMSITEVLDTLKEMIDALAYSEDIGVMSGDILKAYGQDKLFKISPVEPDYMVEPVYNEEVLNQIHNSTVIPFKTLDGCAITQNPDEGYLIWNPEFTYGDVTQSKALVNMPWNDVTPANTMVGTRLTAINGVDSEGKLRLTACGSEVISNRYMFWTQPNGAMSRYEYGKALFYGGPNDTHDLGALMAAISNFDWHPLMPVIHEDLNSKLYTIQGLLGDINNYTTIDDYNLSQMHLAALLSEFNVPQIGSF